MRRAVRVCVGVSDTIPLMSVVATLTSLAFAAYPPTADGTFKVAVDHFSYATPAARFHLRYLAYSGFASPTDAPVLLYAGNEGAIEVFYNATGAIFDHARALGAHVLFIEHRYYGSSLPFGPNASFSPEGLRFLTIEQALADYAEVIVALPRLLGCQGSGARRLLDRCDVILIGGSYGGMLAAWHRLKYPWLSVGAIASGAPIDFYPGMHVQETFLEAVIDTFDRYGGHRTCAGALKLALAAADSATIADLAAAGVHPCQPFGPESVERYAFYAKGALASLAMVDYPYPADFIAPLPANPVQKACAALVRTNSTGATVPRPRSLLQRLHAAVLGLVNASKDLRCVGLEAELVGGDTARAATGHLGAVLRGTDLGVTAWNYQACTELILEPMTSDGYGFYPEAEDQIRATRSLCASRYSVEPRPAWMPTAFGRGADFAAASNIIFMENEKDPWHVGTASVARSGGANGTVVRVLARGGAHHQDLRAESPFDSPDVKAARAYERMAMRAWLGLGGESEWHHHGITDSPRSGRPSTAVPAVAGSASAAA